jgi:hypothetical protein
MPPNTEAQRELIAQLEPRVRRAFQPLEDGRIIMHQELLPSWEYLGRLGLRERSGKRLTPSDQGLSDLLRLRNCHEAFIRGAADSVAALDRDRRRILRDLLVHGPRAHAFYAAVRPGDYARVASSCVTPVAASPRAREHRPAARRRTSSSSTTSSSDPPQAESEPAAPRLTLAPKPPAVYSYALLTPEQRGEDGDPEPPRRRYLVDDHFCVVSLEVVA